jgi:histidinol-phosphate aminotransferase
MNILQLVRPNIISMKPYHSARDEYSGTDAVFLDANENPFGELNRYPDPHQKALKQKLCELKSVPVENIFIGNGSDEIIDLSIRIFCRPGKDRIIVCPPSYGMYEVCAMTNDVEVVNVALTREFQLDTENILNKDAKILFICSPNNPTGNSMNGLDRVIADFPGIVVLDEAYIDFSSSESYISRIKDFPNLIISQTFSKAWGHAAVRVGLAYSNAEIIAIFNKIKPPYNVSELNQKAAIRALSEFTSYEQQLGIILEQRDWLYARLRELPIVKKVYPSDANFLLVKFENARSVYNQLVDQKVITRLRASVVKDSIRITIGTPEENAQLIKELKKLAQ